MCTSVAISASRNRLCWKLPIGWPNEAGALGVEQISSGERNIP
jgi:hypothetical protein